ncbi:glycosyltransferase involved in cell wall biosynthesis [Pedobacter sp. AK017]|uniref:glycosyltransferase n=1 Tax=Pedobacter sp. AK017 TaxID=2723073 RepID=UPI00160AAD01|nr:glycosyltransferase [Pedobacter sp. AK017]MBB5436379.1 glycosyltransferase involved in cell wall biosynthesis [Pedobacter sp. AK017]
MGFKNDIIIIGQQPWDTEIGSNCKDIALEFSKTNRVLYINSPLDRITMMRGKNNPRIQKRLQVIRKKEEGLYQVQDNLWNLYTDCIVESINWINSSKLFNFLNKNNNGKLSKSIVSAIEKLDFQNVILFNDNEMFKAFYLKEYLKPTLSIYYSRDYMIGVNYWKKHGVRLEPLLIAKSDLCFSNSEYLAEYCRQYNPYSFNVGQGCDVRDFIAVTTPVPEELKNLDRKLIGYVGSLNSERLDLKVIEEIAEAFPECDVVLVGPEDEQFKSSKLHQMQNVIFTGQKPVHELPAYINSFDVCINPQVLNEITIGNYPRKIDEYLAMGKAVVATKTKTMEFFADFVYLAETGQDYIMLIRIALAENNEASKLKRINFALTHTWEESVKKMTNEIDKMLKVK